MDAELIVVLDSQTGGLRDVLDGLGEIKVCVAYRLDGELLERPPLEPERYQDCEPVYETLPGWSEPTAGVTDIDALPGAARAYLQRYADVAAHTPESLWLGVRTENQLGDDDQMATYRLKLRAKFPDSDEAKYLESIE